MKKGNFSFKRLRNASRRNKPGLYFQWGFCKEAMSDEIKFKVSANARCSIFLLSDSGHPHRPLFRTVQLKDHWSCLSRVSAQPPKSIPSAQWACSNYACKRPRVWGWRDIWATTFDMESGQAKSCLKR